MSLIKIKKENKIHENPSKLDKQNESKKKIYNKKELIKLNEKEKQILTKIKENLKVNNITTDENFIFKFILKNINPDSLTRKIIRSKIKVEEILNRAKTRADRIWL